MPKLITPLSNLDCQRHKHHPGERGKNKLRDGGGLFLEALPSGRKVWRLEYKTARGSKTNATLPHDFGTADGSLAKARAWREEMRALIEQGIDPNAYAAQQARTKQAAQLNTFEAAAKEWLEHKSVNWSPAQVKKVSGIVRRALLPSIGKRPIAEITPAEILHILKRYEKAGKLETAHSAREYTASIFRRAIVHGIAESDPTQPLRGALQPKGHRNLAHLTDPAEIGALMRAIDSMDGSPVVVAATKLSPLLFVRPGELRKARWNEIDLDNRVWNIPAERMKARRPHAVPLCDQAVAILEELAPFSRHSPESYVFPSIRTNRTPMSENTVNVALRRIGFTGDQQTAHGFRHMASTRLHEMGWPSHVVEKQLAHKDSNQIRAVYNKAEYWPEREKMMQAWADYLDSLKVGESRVTPIRKVAS